MTAGQIALLAIVQGITEFLPVSSSGHLVVARLIFDIPDATGTATDAFLHLGTLLAVLIYYWKVWWGITRGILVRDKEGNDKRQLLGKIILATIPAAFAGYLWADAIDAAFRGARPVAVGFVMTAVIFLLAEFWHKRQPHKKRAGWMEAAVIGLAQAVALVPGVSRSGTTISAGRAQGLSRSQAIHFSFLMSVPIIAGAGIGTLPTLLASHTYPASILLLGFILSFLSGLAAIHLLVQLTRRISFVPFALYLLVMAGILFVLF